MKSANLSVGALLLFAKAQTLKKLRKTVCEFDGWKLLKIGGEFMILPVDASVVASMEAEKKVIAADVVADRKAIGEILRLCMKVFSNIVGIVGKYEDAVPLRSRPRRERRKCRVWAITAVLSEQELAGSAGSVTPARVSIERTCSSLARECGV